MPDNEVLVCATCHALIHQGLLSVSGRAGSLPGEGLTWSTRASSLDLRVRARREGRLRRRPQALRVASKPVESQRDAELVAALTRLQFSENEARKRLSKARERLAGGDSLEEHDLLREALRA